MAPVKAAGTDADGSRTPSHRRVGSAGCAVSFAQPARRMVKVAAARADTRVVNQSAATASARAPVTGRDTSRLSYRQLAVLESSKQAIRELGTRVTLSTARLSEIALADPGLALQLLREANVQARERRELEVSGVSHAMMLLGMEQTLDFIARLRSIESVKPRKRREGLLHATARAVHAGALAHRWSRSRGETAAETAAVAALTRHAAELVLWCGDTEAVDLFAHLHHAGDDRERLESEFLGISLTGLGHQLANEAGLPITVRAAIDDAAALNARLAPSVLASALAQATAFDWHGDRNLELVALYADLSAADPDDALSELHSLTADIARRSPFGHALTAARYMLLPPGDRFEAEELAAPPPRRVLDTTPPAPRQAAASVQTIRHSRPAPAAAQPGDVQLPLHPVDGVPGGESVTRDPAPTTAHTDEAFRHCVHLLSEVRRGRTPVQKALPAVIDGLRDGLGFKRVVFALRSREHSTLQARYTSGEPRHPALEVDLSRANLVSRLMQTPQSIWLHAGTRKTLWPYLPRNLRAYVGDRDFCAMSLFVQDKAVGLLYADYENGCIDEKAFHRFKRIATELAGALAPRRTTRA